MFSRKYFELNELNSYIYNQQSYRRSHHSNEIKIKFLFGNTHSPE